jgi:hypothetical protein
MNFSVRFTTDDKNKRLFDTIGAPGIDILDYIRKLYPQYDNITTDNIFIDTTCPVSKHQMSVTVSEKIARSTGMFKGTVQIPVVVPEYGLSRFLDFMDVDLKYHEILAQRSREVLGIKVRNAVYTKKITGVSFKSIVSDKLLINEWLDADCPIQWDPNTMGPK